MLVGAERPNLKASIAIAAKTLTAHCSRRLPAITGEAEAAGLEPA
jgi:hypothetical protein